MADYVYVYVEYPKWVAGQIVNDAAEEIALLEHMTAPAVAVEPAPVETEPKPEARGDILLPEDIIRSGSMSGRTDG